MRRIVLPVAVLLLAGCTTAAPSPVATPLIPITHPHALLSCPSLPAMHLDAVPEETREVRRCRVDFHDVQGVLNKVQYVERLVDDPSELLAEVVGQTAGELEHRLFGHVGGCE